VADAPEKEPAAQSTQVPPEARLPAAQAAQPSPWSMWPVGHMTHVFLLFATSRPYPTGQWSAHSAAPSKLTLEAGHLRHEVPRRVGLYVPAGHARQHASVQPNGERQPAECTRSGAIWSGGA